MIGSWRVALRVARREAWRAKGRYAVAFVMVLLPVLAVVALDVAARTIELSPAESLGRNIGSAAALAEWSGSANPVAQSPDAGDRFSACDSCAEFQLPDTAAEAAIQGAAPVGSRLVPYREGEVAVKSDLGFSRPQSVELDISDPLAAGLFEAIQGRVPQSDDEVAVTPRLAKRGFEVGSRLTLESGRQFKVVGTVRSTLDHQLNAVVGQPGSFNADRRFAWLIDSPDGVSWEEVRRLNSVGVYVVSRDVVEHPPPESQWPPEISTGGDTDQAALAVLGLVAVMVLLEVVLLAGPAFAVGARRQRRALALITAAGGEPRHVRRIVLASGLIVGVAASVSGAVLGIALAWAGGPILERVTNESAGPLDIRAGEVLLVVAVGTVSALLAAMVPAWSASRLDVVRVLAGRRGQSALSWPGPVAGAALFSIGIVLAVLGSRQGAGGEYAIALSALPTILGAVLLTPWFVILLGRMGTAMPLPVRFAVRDGARQRGRTAPAVAAVLATVAGVVALAIGAASDAAQSRAEWTPLAPSGTGVLRTQGADSAVWAALQRAVTKELPGAEVIPVKGVDAGLGSADGSSSEVMACPVGAEVGADGCPLLASSGDTLGGQILVGENVLDLLEFPHRKAQLPAALAALRAGGVVVFSEKPLEGDRVDVVRTTVGADGTRTGVSDRRSVKAARLAYGGAYGPAVMIVSESAAKQLGLQVSTTALVARGKDISLSAEDAVNEAARGVSANAWFGVERGYTGDDTRLVLLLLGTVGGLLVVVAAITATALALSDARPDLATLAAVGASPRVRRGIAASYAASIGLLGSVIGAAVGLVPGIAVAYPLTGSSWLGPESVDMNGAQLPSVFIDVPWLLIGWIVFAVPLIAAAAVAITTRSRLPMIRRIP